MNIVLTGASRGIGYQTALAICEKDDVELVLISRNEAALEQLKEDCEKVNPSNNILIISGDISEISSGKISISDKTGWDRCDILINNAGVLVNKPFLEQNDLDVQKMFEVNTFAPVRMVRMLYCLLEKPTCSHVLNISSMGGFQGSSKFPGLSYYSASKAALASLTECMAEELKDSGIRFNCLALGAVQTEMLNEAFPGFQAPVGAKEMGKYIADFALNGHKFFNGKILPVSVSTP